MRLLHFFSISIFFILVACGGAEERVVEETAETTERSAEGAEATVDAAGEAAADAAEAAADAIGEVAADTAERRAPPPPESARLEMKYCDVLRTPTSVVYCDLVEEQQIELNKGVAAFNPPREMIRGRVKRVRFAIGLEQDRQATVDAAGGDSETKIVSIKQGRFMSARLSGAGFEIDPVGSEARDLGITSDEVWEWDVKPTSDGEQELQIRLETFAEIGGKNTRLAIYTSPPIKVMINIGADETREAKRKAALENIGFGEQILTALTSWFTALGLLGLAIGVAYWRWRKIGSKPSEDETQDEEG